jgi:hypothetical protein
MCRSWRHKMLPDDGEKCECEVAERESSSRANRECLSIQVCVTLRTTFFLVIKALLCSLLYLYLVQLLRGIVVDMAAGTSWIYAGR